VYVVTVTGRTRARLSLGLLLLAGLIVWQLNSPVVREEIRDVSADLQPGLRPIYSAKTDEKVVALTFDISWGDKTWPKVLQILKDEKVPSTFFLSGPWSKNHADAVRAIAAAGHQIESHGQRHDDFDKMSRQQVGENIQQAHAILEGLTRRAPRYIRPPNGAFNKSSVQAAKDLGYATVIWSVDSLDWKNPGVGTIINRVVRLTHPGAIILTHSTKQTLVWYPVIGYFFHSGGRLFPVQHGQPLPVLLFGDRTGRELTPQDGQRLVAANRSYDQVCGYCRCGDQQQP
jgi:polysaccharide deacetylase family sporulation protein PdaB